MSTMTKITDSDKPLHGPRRALVCGYEPLEQDALCEMVEHEKFADLPVVFCCPQDGGCAMSELFAREDRHGAGQESRMPRAVILGGVTEKELRRFMAMWREMGLPPQLWAVLTPTTEGWTLRQLITELQREHKEMQRAREAQARAKRK